MRSGVLTGIDTSWRSASSGSHCPNERTLDPAVLWDWSAFIHLKVIMYVFTGMRVSVPNIFNHSPRFGCLFWPWTPNEIKLFK